MAWVVRMAIDFEEEFAVLAGPVQTELLANACLIARFGPHLGRPRVDTLKGSRYTNMKELRFEADGAERRYGAHVARVNTHPGKH